jgi:hypothetical protein
VESSQECALLKKLSKAIMDDGAEQGEGEGTDDNLETVNQARLLIKAALIKACDAERYLLPITARAYHVQQALFEATWQARRTLETFLRPMNREMT